MLDKLNEIISNLESMKDKISEQNTDAILLTVLPSTTIYVDGTRTDTYIEQGSNTKPFKTIQAAVNKVNGYNDLNRSYNIKITMFNYNENIFIGLGIHNVCFDCDGIDMVSVHNLTIVNHNSISKVVFKNMQFIGTVNIKNIVSDAIYFDNCCIMGEVYNDNVAFIYYDNCVLYSDILHILNCSNILFHNSFVSSNSMIIQTDELENVPDRFLLGTRIKIENCRVNADIIFSLVNIDTYIDTVLELLNCVLGINGCSVPDGATLVSWNSCLRGNYTGGNRVMHNSVIVP